MSNAAELTLRLALLALALGIFALYGLLWAYNPKGDAFVGVASAAELILGVGVLAASLIPWSER